MRIKKDGTQFAMDMSIQAHAASLGIRQTPNRDRASIGIYYAGLVDSIETLLGLRRRDYDRHYAQASMEAVLAALAALRGEVGT